MTESLQGQSGRSVLFRVACGARQGFGHLVRALRLAECLGAEPMVSVRGSARARSAAEKMGARRAPSRIREALKVRWDAVVVDDPAESMARPWIAGCRNLGIPVVSLHDLGLGADGADLIVDGSVGAGRREWGRQSQVLLGPQFAIVSPELRRDRLDLSRRTPEQTVLIALGGGPRARVAADIGRAVLALRPDVRVTIAGGFLPTHTRIDDGLEWLSDSVGFVPALRRATVVVSGGGVTLYECAAAGVPAVAVAVVAPQQATIQGFLRQGAVADGGSLHADGVRPSRVAREVSRLLDDSRARRALVRSGRTLVDGRGLTRVRDAVLRLIAAGPNGPKRLSI